MSFRAPSKPVAPQSASYGECGCLRLPKLPVKKQAPIHEKQAIVTECDFGVNQRDACCFSAFPACEFCGCDVYPGEEQIVDHAYLWWHKRGCFRCYGCHRQFNGARTCYLLENIALCDECYPRREFLEDDWKSLNNARNLPTRSRKVSFLSPVIKRRNAKPSSLTNSLNSETESPVQDDVTPGADRPPPPLATGSPSSSENDRMTLFREANENENDNPEANKALYTKDFTEMKQTPASPPNREATPAANIQQQNAKPNLQASMNRLKKLYAESENGFPQLNDNHFPAPEKKPVEVIQHECVNDVTATVSCHQVLAVDDWNDVVVDSNVNSDLTTVQKSEASDTVVVARTPEPPIDNEAFPPSFNSFRRTSSCIDLNDIPKIMELPHTSQRIDKNESDASISWLEGYDDKSPTNSADREDVEDARGEDPCCSPSPVPQSSTPIPQHAEVFIENTRPPSGLIESQSWDGHDAHNATTHTISTHGEKKEQCSSCKQPVFRMNRFVCLNRVYHKHCFTCAACQARLSVGTFCDDGKQPFCRLCYVRRNKVSNHHIRRISSTRRRLHSL